MISSSQRASATVSTCSKVNSIMFLILVVVVCVVVGCFDDDAPFCRHEEVIAYSAGPQPASLRFLDFDDGLPFWSVSALDVVLSVAAVWSWWGGCFFLFFSGRAVFEFGWCCFYPFCVLVLSWGRFYFSV